jgi:hypothetical protein
VSLRIDAQERTALHFADYVLSPTAYMLAYLKQRGWQVGRSSQVVPNIVPGAANSAQTRSSKKVWQLAFFGRLEERKGLKLFVGAINRLNFSSFPRLKVFFVGSDAMVDQQPASIWLHRRVQHWPCPTFVYTNLTRQQALETLGQEGLLLVLASRVENQPFVVAEAAVAGIPFITFDVGGMQELLEPAEHIDVLIPQVSEKALFVRMRQVLQQGEIRTAVLESSVRKSSLAWASWHQSHLQSLASLKNEDHQLSAQPLTLTGVISVSLKVQQRALPLKASICSSNAYNKLLILLPPGFVLTAPLDQQTLDQQTRLFQELHSKADLHLSKTSALIFGAYLPDGRAAYPHPPTYMYYDGDQACTEDVPVVIAQDTFCSHYLAESRDFPIYHSWVLFLHLKQVGGMLITLPDIAFNITRFPVEGTGCMLTEPPHFRKASRNSMYNLEADAERTMRQMQGGQLPQAIASLRRQFGRVQGHYGWRFSATSLAGVDYTLGWKEARSQMLYDGHWSCGSPFPFIKRTLLHPCSSNCCGESSLAANIEFKGYIAMPTARLELCFEVWPRCGDGLTIALTHANQTGHQTLFTRLFPPDPVGGPKREVLEYTLSLQPGDLLKLSVAPGANHDCDGVYICNLELWYRQAIAAYSC